MQKPHKQNGDFMLLSEKIEILQKETLRLAKEIELDELLCRFPTLTKENKERLLILENKLMTLLNEYIVTK